MNVTGQKQATKAESKEKSQRAVERIGVEGPAQQSAILAQLADGSAGPSGDGAIQTQAARLGDRRLQRTQRQALALEIGRMHGNQHLQRVVASVTRTAPSHRIARLVEYEAPVSGGQHTDPELASGVLPFTEAGWNAGEIGRNLSQLGDPTSRHDEVRCVQTSFLVVLIQRGPGAVREMIQNYMRRYRVGLRQASTPARVKRWYRRSLRRLTPLPAKIDNKTLTYEDLSTILREMYAVYGRGMGGTSIATSINMARREGYTPTRIGKRNVDRDEAAEEAQDLEAGEFLDCGVQASQRGTGAESHAVHIGRRPDDTLYFYDPWPIRGDQMVECGEDLSEIDHYFYNPVEEEAEGEGAAEGGEEEPSIEVLEPRTFHIHYKYSPPEEEEGE